MADKDTREAYGPAGEAMPFPEAPRSEGGPATREPQPQGVPQPDAAAHGADGAAEVQPSDVAPSAAEHDAGESAPTGGLAASEHGSVPDADARLQPEGPQPAGEAPVAEGHGRAADPAASASEMEAAPSAPSLGAPASADVSPDIADVPSRSDPHDVSGARHPADGATGAKGGEAWHSVIADAISEPPAEAPSDVVDKAGPLDRLRGAAPAAPPRAPGDDPDVASFTAAVEDLFRPPETKEEPHLITLGRRLDPALRIPKPQPPDITAARDAMAEGKPWSKGPSWSKGIPWVAHLRTAARYAIYALLGYLGLVLVLIVLFRFVNPPGSMLMLSQLVTGTAIDRRWVPLGAISPHLVRAVIVSEDGRFCEHSGVDTDAIKEAIDRAARGTPRGASTISMQLTKNLFLWNAKSYLRKVIEIPLTLLMELIWPKWRVLEVYLNVAEWGPGIFGAEAAAQRHFDKPAARLTEREAALLAAVLPNPVVRDASNPGPRTAAKARVVQSRVKAYGAVASCVVSAAAAAPRPASAVPSVRPRPARKTAPVRQAPARKKQQPEATDPWAPSLNFGPR